jgi:RNA polymerase primary sigma factor
MGAEKIAYYAEEPVDGLEEAESQRAIQASQNQRWLLDLTLEDKSRVGVTKQQADHLIAAWTTLYLSRNNKVELGRESADRVDLFASGQTLSEIASDRQRTATSVSRSLKNFCAKLRREYSQKDLLTPLVAGTREEAQAIAVGIIKSEQAQRVGRSATADATIEDGEAPATVASGRNERTSGTSVAAAADLDLTRVYLKEIGAVPLLAAAQEVDLARRIEAGLFAEHKLELEASGEILSLVPKARDELRALASDLDVAKQTLISANLRLVVSVAKRYVGLGLPLMDLTQEGSLGLIRAAEKFDYSQGYKFSTYATWWIRQSMLRAIAHQARTIRIPGHLVEDINRITRQQRKLTVSLGREPTDEELAAELNTTPAKVAKAIGIDRDSTTTSLDALVGNEGGDTAFGDFIEDATAVDPVKAVALGIRQADIVNALSKLSPQDREIIRLRFGFVDGKSWTLAEVGTKLQLPREHISRIEKRTLGKLQNRDRGSGSKLRSHLYED